MAPPSKLIQTATLFPRRATRRPNSTANSTAERVSGANAKHSILLLGSVRWSESRENREFKFSLHEEDGGDNEKSSRGKTRMPPRVRSTGFVFGRRASTWTREQQCAPLRVWQRPHAHKGAPREKRAERVPICRRNLIGCRRGKPNKAAPSATGRFSSRPTESRGSLIRWRRPEVAAIRRRRLVSPSGRETWRTRRMFARAPLLRRRQFLHAARGWATRNSRRGKNVAATGQIFGAD